MSKRTLVAMLVIALLGAGAWACGDTPVTPKSQCQDGSTRAVHSGKKVTYQRCSNGEWTKVDCLNGGTKTTRGVHYTCRDNEWDRD